ncbi:MAG TPA: hypothetical protein VM934_15245 [Pyrinomonadaceae bacterium]|jgi:hypothetical protein|nr:hypothetical protein [Pyrinomonadaceae bacterium]
MRGWLSENRHPCAARKIPHVEAGTRGRQSREGTTRLRVLRIDRDGDNNDNA